MVCVAVAEERVIGGVFVVGASAISVWCVIAEIVLKMCCVLNVR